MFDTLITHARIHDGLGSEPFVGHLALSGGVIAQVMPALQGQTLPAATHRVSAEGLDLMPGIIDNHTHYDAQITWDPYLDQSVGMGVTTALIGNCGFTIAPCHPDAASRDLVTKNLTQVEGMSLASLQEGIRWNFESFSEYMDQIEAGRSAMNIGVFVGHSTLRTYVMGTEGSDRVATPEEVARMQDLVERRSMQEPSVWPRPPPRRTMRSMVGPCPHGWPTGPSFWRWPNPCARATRACS